MASGGRTFQEEGPVRENLGWEYAQGAQGMIRRPGWLRGYTGRLERRFALRGTQSYRALEATGGSQRNKERRWHHQKSTSKNSSVDC